MGFGRVGRHELLWIGRLLVLMQLVHGVVGWGKDGHYAVCKIAEGYLTKDALATVRELLPDLAGGELASVCSWPDDIKWYYKWHWTSPLHYVDTPDFKCNYDYCRDCHDSYGHKNSCVTGAIFNYTKQLFSANRGYGPQLSYNLTEALMFLAHYIGDVHQPLHVGFLGDLGGNTITVRWYRRKTNLHHVWDTMIIDSALKTFYLSDLGVMIQAIQRNITDDWSNDISSWENCGHNQTVCPNLYASESVRLACKFAYRNATPGSTLEDEYFLSRLPIVEKRIAQAWSLHRYSSPDDACKYDYSNKARNCHKTSQSVFFGVSINEQNQFNVRYLLALCCRLGNNRSRLASEQNPLGLVSMPREYLLVILPSISALLKSHSSLTCLGQLGQVRSSCPATTWRKNRSNRMGNPQQYSNFYLTPPGDRTSSNPP
ncbi:hypothetical protein V6N13_011499 [Hibiscus sabdariffa]